MTEEEAKKKWCPMIRLNESGNTDSQTPIQKGVAPFYSCIASDCMMWVEDDPELHANQVLACGHCGLAGK